MKTINLSPTWATKADVLGIGMRGLHGSCTCWFKNWIILTVLTLFILLPKILGLRVLNIIQSYKQHRSEKTGQRIILKVYTHPWACGTNFNQNTFAVLLDIAHDAPGLPITTIPSLRGWFSAQNPRTGEVEKFETTRNRPNLLKWTITWLCPMGMKLMKKSKIV